MHITRRLGHRAYQRMRVEHLVREALIAPPPEDDATPPPKPTKASRERERAERLRDRYDALFSLAHSEEVVPWLDAWTQLERTVGAQERHDFLEPFIRRAQRDPQRHRAEIVFLLVVFGPVTGSAVKALRAASLAEPIEVGEIPRFARSEAWILAGMERDRIESAATEAVLTAIARYPTPRPDWLFPWVKNTVGYRLLDLVRDEMAGQAPHGVTAAEQVAVFNTLEDIQDLDPPPMAIDSPERRALARIAIRSGLPGLADQYSEHREVRDACHRAVGRLSARQQQVVNLVALGEYTAQELADRRRVKRSTIDNLAAQARTRMRGDDVFFVELHRLGAVRDQARLAYIAARFPDGYLPDGRRRVAIAA